MSKKRKFLEALLEIVGEVVLTLVFGGIGLLILGLFGVKSPLESLDGDLLVLIGIGAFAVIAAIVILIVKLIKRR